MIDPNYLPPRLDVPSVAEAAEHYRKLHDEHSAAAGNLRQLEERRRTAVEADRAAYADAIRAGDRDPGQKAVEKIDAELIAGRRRVEALAVAVRGAEGDFRNAVAAARGEWAALLARQAAEARESYDQALAALASSLERLREVNGTASWLERFPAEKMFFKPGGPTRLASLPSRAGEGYLVSAVVDALRSVNDPPPSPPVVPLQPSTAA